ncbi:GAF domain-containing sensor histidine kinase [Gordonibacter massiliensis (ex Traore et al. 2017)]|uniref:GAF domain-containing sensor histidine kinase n=1 Tax=Gordonibacter massiliensis (ex Traore et al. 2017) TaxID=1841863 RepID=UPI001C8B3969|nr:GAF domain-containing sensor histidine kinase [Gordonibacter massiliensis (ex Traore et al. 2017)]MBX9033155.1 GAF domain-containing sensor histidine kinase [Gordonibacter massiliensis (ex Traore et al. 2017)]
MGASNFTDDTLAGGCAAYRDAVEDLKARHGFDFVSIGLTAFIGAPLKWVYSAGATGERHRRIVLAPGHGIGGITIKSGKPMMFVDIDEEIDPREYSSYPIVFAEDLRSFCALPLKKDGRVVAVLLCAYRSVSDRHEESYRRLIEDLDGRLLDFDVMSDDFMDFESIAAEKRADSATNPIFVRSELSRVIAAQEDERKRISRELHDGVAQELLSISFLFNQMAGHLDDVGTGLLGQARNTVDRILDELHNISVELRPSALDHLGFLPALRSQAAVFEKTYGAEIVFEGSLSCDRFDQALETQAYRICQEAILNACKYADTERVFVTLEDADGWLHVSVVDHGRGFNTANPEIKGSGCGLYGMQERANLIGARLTTSSGPGGTTVTLVAPMHVVEGKEASR